MDGFTEDQRIESFERQYRVGQVYKLFCTFTILQNRSALY